MSARAKSPTPRDRRELADRAERRDRRSADRPAGPRGDPSRRREDGSIAIEYVIAAPLLLLVFALIFAFARVGEVNGQLDTATRDAARTISLLPDLTQAQQVAQRVVADQLGADGEGGCSASTVRVDVTATRPDGHLDDVPAPGDTVTVTASCPYSLTDLGLPVPMGDLTAHSQFSSIIDPNRTG